MAIQAQLQALLTAVFPRPNTRSNVEVAKPQTFNREVCKVSSFLMAYKLYIRMRMREMLVEKQI